MVNVEIIRNLHHGTKNYVPGDMVYIDDRIARSWVTIGAAKLEKAVAGKVVEKAVKAASVPTGQIQKPKGDSDVNDSTSAT